jgi:hypothetical protein
VASVASPASLQHEDPRVDRAARRWGGGLLAVDLVGLPALLVVTSWRWPTVVLVWAGAVALLLVVGVLRHHRREPHHPEVVPIASGALRVPRRSVMT